MATSTPSTSTSKRHSLAISTGPKPLHLTPGPSTAPHSSLTFTHTNTTPPYTPLSARPYARGHGNKGKRQSSISYISSSGDGVYSERSAALGRSNSLLVRRDDSHKKSAPLSASVSTGGGGEGERKRPPLTLAEKHADLLHFIAQKESKCLELRSQLAVHEAELLQLKRKWERIVNRGFERDLSSSSSSSPPNSSILPGAINTNTNSNSNATLVDGIKEGVQGLNRLFSSSSLSQSQSSAQATAYPPSPATTPPLLRQTRKQHETKQSISTTSSCSYTSANSTSKSRFSLSSASSIGEERLGEKEKEKEEEVLIVRDTGATPTMSPNPDWVKRVGSEEGEASAVARKGLRRRSGGVVSPPPELSLNEDREEEEEDKKRVGFSPLAAAAAPGGWVESMGKKIGELRGGAGFSKSQKRASLLISDVSQSFMSVISNSTSSTNMSTYSPVPSASYTSYKPTTSKPTSTSSLSLKPSPKPTSSKPTPSTPTSLLDDDDDFTFTSSSNPIMQPSPALKPPMVPTRKAALEAGKGGVRQEEEDEWNW